MIRSKMVSLEVVVALLAAICLTSSGASGDVEKDGRREDRTVARVPSTPGTTGFETQTVEADSISLSALLEGAGVETSEDMARFLNSLFPPSFKMLTGGGIVLAEASLATQYTIPSNRPGRAFFVPDSEATAEDGPLTEFVEFSGWAADYLVTGSFFIAGRELIVDIEWTQADGTIVLVESFAKTVHAPAPTEVSVASDNYPSVSKSFVCKCSDPRGACSDRQCRKATRCWTGGTISCSYVWE